MRIIVETQSRMRARLRTRMRIAVVRAFRTLAGVPVDREGAVTIRRISRLRKAVRSVVSDPLVRNRHARIMLLGLLAGSAHVIFALLNIFVGVFTRSLWTLSVGVVIAALNVGKSYVASGAFTNGDIDEGAESIESLKRCRNAGIALALLVVAMSGTVMRLVVHGFGGSYSGALIYAYALYALLQIVISLVNLVRARKEELVQVKGVRAFSLASALISIFALQTVLLSRVGWESLPVKMTRRIAEGAVGSGVCAGMIALGVWLARSAGIRLAERRADPRMRFERLPWRGSTIRDEQKRPL